MLKFQTIARQEDKHATTPDLLLWVNAEAEGRNPALSGSRVTCLLAYAPLPEAESRTLPLDAAADLSPTISGNTTAQTSPPFLSSP